MRMQALARYRHRGVMLGPLDTFDVQDEAEARELVAVGFARRLDVAALEQPPAPAPALAPAYAQAPPRAPARYERRDSRAKR